MLIVAAFEPASVAPWSSRCLWKTPVFFLAIIALVASPLLGDSHSPTPPGTVRTLRTRSPVRTLIVLVMQNRSFDHLFGSYPGDVDGIRAEVRGYLQPDGDGNAVSPHQLREPMTQDLAHDPEDYVRAWNGGLMDGFAATMGPLSLGFYDHTMPGVDILWGHARQYALADQYFVMGKSIDQLFSDEKLIQSVDIQWFYERSDICSERAVKRKPSPADGLATFYRMLESGSLPAVSVVHPSSTHSSHPGCSSISSALQWIDSFVQRIQNSSSWESAAVIVTWDESGGWWDHAAPLGMYSSDPAFRVPMLLISPFAKRDYVSHELMDPRSTLRFIQWNWASHTSQPAAASQEDLGGMFDFPNSDSDAPATSGQCSAGALSSGSSPRCSTGSLPPGDYLRANSLSSILAGQSIEPHAGQVRGTEQRPGLAQAQSSPPQGQQSGIRYCDQFPGPDAGTKINACIDDLGSSGGTADAQGLQGEQTIAGTITLAKPVRLLLGNANLRYIGAGTALLVTSSNVEITGSVGNRTRFIYTGSDPVSLIKSAAAGYLKVSNLSITFGSDNNPSTAIYLQDPVGFDVSDIVVASFASAGSNRIVGLKIEATSSSLVPERGFGRINNYIYTATSGSEGIGSRGIALLGVAGGPLVNVALTGYGNIEDAEVGLLLEKAGGIVMTGSYLFMGNGTGIRLVYSSGNTFVNPRMSQPRVSHFYVDTNSSDNLFINPQMQLPGAFGVNSGVRTLILNNATSQWDLGSIPLRTTGNITVGTITTTSGLINRPDNAGASIATGNGSNTLFGSFSSRNALGNRVLFEHDLSNFYVRIGHVLPGTSGQDIGSKFARWNIYAATVNAELTATTGLVINGGTPLLTSNHSGTGNLVLATFPTISYPKIDSGVSPDGSGLKHRRVATGPIAAGSSAEVHLTWQTAFADANYTSQCSIAESTSSLTVVALSAQTPAMIVVSVRNTDTNTSRSGILNCIALHD